MNRNKLHLLVFLIYFFGVSQNNYSQAVKEKDTLYFNSSWKETTRENHKFYRLLPLKKIGKLSLIIDYHKNGNMQMQGYVYTDNLKVNVGDFYRYDENGFDTSHEQNLNAENTPLKYYYHNGELWKTYKYKNGVKDGIVEIFNNKGVVVNTENYKKGLTNGDVVGKFNQRYYSARKHKADAFNKNVPELDTLTKVVFWENTDVIAEKTKFYKPEYGRYFKLKEESFYSKKGKLVQHLYEKDFVNKRLLEGAYYTIKTKNGFAVEFDTIYYSNQQSSIIKINDISYIGADNGELTFFKKGDNNDYLELDYEFLYNSEKFNKSFRIETSNDPYKATLKKINTYFDKTINVNNIKSQSVKSLYKTILNKEWSLQYKRRGEYSDSDSIVSKTIFTGFNKGHFTHLDLKFDKVNNGGFGSYIKDKDNDIRKWRLNSVDFYDINILLINGNKPIITLSQEDDIEFYIIPTVDNKLIVSFDEKVTEKKKTNLNKSVFKELLENGDSNEYFNVFTKKSKNYIVNFFNEIVVDKAYDSIQKNNQYIIGRNKKSIDVYNFKLDKLPIDNIRQVYYHRDNLQVLTNNEVKYFNVLGEETKVKNISYSFCGTVGHTYFNITPFSKNKKFNAINITTDGPGGFPSRKVLLLKNLPIENDITFLNKSKKDGYTGNSSFVEGYVNRTNTLVVVKNNKVGLYSYNKNDIKFKKKDDELNDFTGYASTNAKELLPIIYDKIELKDQLIIVEKSNKLGIYPLKNGLVYKSFGSVNTNYMPYEKLDGEKGWIDVNTHDEYPNM